MLSSRQHVCGRGAWSLSASFPWTNTLPACQSNTSLQLKTLYGAVCPASGLHDRKVLQALSNVCFVLKEDGIQVSVMSDRAHTVAGHLVIVAFSLGNAQQAASDALLRHVTLDGNVTLNDAQRHQFVEGMANMSMITSNLILWDFQNVKAFNATQNPVKRMLCSLS